MIITKVTTLEAVQFLYLFSWPPIYQLEHTNRQAKHHIGNKTLHFSHFRLVT